MIALWCIYRKVFSKKGCPKCPLSYNVFIYIGLQRFFRVSKACPWGVQSVHVLCSPSRETLAAVCGGLQRNTEHHKNCYPTIHQGGLYVLGTTRLTTVLLPCPTRCQWASHEDLLWYRSRSKTGCRKTTTNGLSARQHVKKGRRGKHLMPKSPSSITSSDYLVTLPW